LHSSDRKGYLTEDNSFSADGKFEKTFTYSHDSLGNVTEDNSFDSGNKNKKNVIEETTVSPDGSKLIYTYVYAYDAKDNWIRKIKFSGQKPVNILEREIIYY